MKEIDECFIQATVKANFSTTSYTMAYTLTAHFCTSAFMTIYVADLMAVYLIELLFVRVLPSSLFGGGTTSVHFLLSESLYETFEFIFVLQNNA